MTILSYLYQYFIDGNMYLLTELIFHDTINMQHGDFNQINKVKPKEGQRKSLCCNNIEIRCPSLVFNSPQEEELCYKEYADLITELFLENYEKRNPEQYK